MYTEQYSENSPFCVYFFGFDTQIITEGVFLCKFFLIFNKWLKYAKNTIFLKKRKMRVFFFSIIIKNGLLMGKTRIFCRELLPL